MRKKEIMRMEYDLSDLQKHLKCEEECEAVLMAYERGLALERFYATRLGGSIVIYKDDSMLENPPILARIMRSDYKTQKQMWLGVQAKLRCYPIERFD